MPMTRQPSLQLAAALLDDLGVRARDGFVIRDAGARHLDRRDAGAVRLDLLDLLRADLA